MSEKHRITWALIAIQDLDEILEYIAAHDSLEARQGCGPARVSNLDSKQSQGSEILLKTQVKGPEPCLEGNRGLGGRRAVQDFACKRVNEENAC